MVGCRDDIRRCRRRDRCRHTAAVLRIRRPAASAPGTQSARTRSHLRQPGGHCRRQLRARRVLQHRVDEDQGLGRQPARRPARGALRAQPGRQPRRPGLRDRGADRRRRRTPDHTRQPIAGRSAVLRDDGASRVDVDLRYGLRSQSPGRLRGTCRCHVVSVTGQHVGGLHQRHLHRRGHLRARR